MNRVIENRRRGNDRSDILRSWPRRWKILIVKKISFHSFSIYIHTYSFEIVNVISSKFYKISDV